jgi:altronate hydrolase
MEYDFTSAALRLHRDDHVAVVTRDLEAGDDLIDPTGNITVSSTVQFGHKIAVRKCEQGQAVRKYGQIIGLATTTINIGDHVHLHNLALPPDTTSYEFGTDIRLPTPDTTEVAKTFLGYLRDDGRVGTRNYVAVISTVNCSASVTRLIAQRARETLLQDFPNVDGIIGLTHKNGCGAPIDGPDYRQLQRTLAGHANHPNVAEALFVGLGCEGNQAAVLVDAMGLTQIARKPAPAYVNIQESGGTERTVSDGLHALLPILQRANEVRRTEQPISKLCVALQCGGSDGNSGITANPAVGAAMDTIVACGGTAVLGETPEIFGAEHLLTRRAVDEKTGRRLLERIDWWKWYTGIWDATMDANPAPGNKDGGITTIHEKSLGAVAKAGTSPLRWVYEYAERVTESGFVFMDTPGYDPASITGLIAGGANLVIFTTGRGSCFGSAAAPTLKIATNTPMFDRISDDMDIDAGIILAGATVEEVGRTVCDTLIRMASGEKSKSESQMLGEEEFSPWILGPVM